VEPDAALSDGRGKEAGLARGTNEAVEVRSTELNGCPPFAVELFAALLEELSAGFVPPCDGLDGQPEPGSHREGQGDEDRPGDSLDRLGGTDHDGRAHLQSPLRAFLMSYRLLIQQQDVGSSPHLTRLAYSPAPAPKRSPGRPRGPLAQRLLAPIPLDEQIARTDQTPDGGSARSRGRDGSCQGAGLPPSPRPRHP